MARAPKGNKTQELKSRNTEGRFILESIEAISSDEDEGYDDKGKEEWNAEALALRQAIKEGAFNHLVKKSEGVDNDEESDQSVDEVEHSENETDRDEVEENSVDSGTNDQSDETPDDHTHEVDDDEGKSSNIANSSAIHGKALAAVLEELQVAKQKMPWPELFVVVPKTPLPFGGRNADGDSLDIHDDLKREMAFYNLALEATIEARLACIEDNVPFTRPDDFFAEMVKTDDHMAKVKDRLIFETKKMDAVAQRKTNKEQKLLAKEKATNSLLEKSKRKKEHFKAVNEWAKSAAQNRGSALREDDDAHLAKVSKTRGWTDREGNIQFGPNKKRMAADSKYGHGGKRGRFKQNDPKERNDMSGFNPKGNFGGLGSKSKGKKAAAHRPGKRARDAKKSSR